MRHGLAASGRLKPSLVLAGSECIREKWKASLQREVMTPTNVSASEEGVDGVSRVFSYLQVTSASNTNTLLF